jgi:hypothetical protein
MSAARARLGAGSPPAEPAGTDYGGVYFGEGRDPLDRMGLSGYERYERDTSNADVAAYVAWRHFRPATMLDVGAARGFVVEAVRELGVDASGVDVSEWAVEHAAEGARGHMRVGDLIAGLDDADDSVELVTALETLEHLPPATIPTVVSEMARVSRRWVMATIPSFGPNANGPDGWFQVKVRDDRVAHYEALGSDYQGPVPYEDLYLDARGEPIEGHLTVASYSWWEERFAEAGLVRCGEVERRIHKDLFRFGLTKFWNLYVLRHEGVGPPPSPAALADDDEARSIESRWALDTRTPDESDAALLMDSHGVDLSDETPGRP